MQFFSGKLATEVDESGFSDPDHQHNSEHTGGNERGNHCGDNLGSAGREDAKCKPDGDDASAGFHALTDTGFSYERRQYARNVSGSPGFAIQLQQCGKPKLRSGRAAGLHSVSSSGYAERQRNTVYGDGAE